MNLSSEQLEQESERTRARLAETLEELRARLTPGQVVDQLVDYARDGAAGEFVRNLGHEVRRNPLPITLIGAGIGWLMMANGRSHRSDFDATARKARDAAGTAADRLRAGAADLGERGKSRLATLANEVGNTAEAVSENATTLGSAVADAGRQTRGWLSGAAQRAAAGIPSTTDAAHSLGDTAARASRSARSVTHDIAQLCAEQPLVVAGLGIALGAAIGAALPPSESEDRLLGRTSDAFKEGAQEQASELYEKAQNVAQATAQAAGKAVENERLTDPTSWQPAAGISEGDDPASFAPS